MWNGNNLRHLVNFVMLKGRKTRHNKNREKKRRIKEKNENLTYDRRRSLPFQAPPLNCPFPVACPRRHHRHLHFSGSNQLTNKEKGRRQLGGHPYFLVNICDAHFWQEDRTNERTNASSVCNNVFQAMAWSKGSLSKRRLCHQLERHRTKCSTSRATVLQWFCLRVK